MIKSNCKKPSHHDLNDKLIINWKTNKKQALKKIN